MIVEKDFLMIIECSYCEARVDGKIMGEHITYPDEFPGPIKTLLLECPVCKNSLLGYQELIQMGNEKQEWFDGDERLWPIPKKGRQWMLPEIIADSIAEAERCFTAKSYNACAVMSGRALEGLCQHFQTKSKTISGGLKELLESNIIDERLFSWGDALRQQRNLGAHASSENITKQDAKDILDFTNAINEYIFVLSKKFNDFLLRQQKKSEK